MDTVFNALKERQRKERHSYDQNLTVRVHRALSWLQRAELCDKDLDGRFVFLWISFNAAYAHEIKNNYSLYEQEMFNAFLEKLHQLDTRERFQKLVWQEYTNSIRILLNNKHVFQPFWDCRNGKISDDQWIERFELAKKNAAIALGKGDTPRVLAIVMSRLYTLRNQLIHGGATWNSNVNRDQIRDCTRFLNSLVPIVIETMMDNPQDLWGQPCYPVVSE